MSRECACVRVDLFDERKAGVLKSAERTIRAYHILKGNPDLMNTHMKYNLGKVFLMRDAHHSML